MKSAPLTITAIAIAASFAFEAGAVCVDEHGISGYHIPLEKEVQTAHVVAIGTVISEKQIREPDPQWIAGTLYRFKIEETVRGRRYKTLDLFSENTSGRFPMDVGHKYLVFVNKDAHGFFVTNCGSSGELPGQSQVLEAVRKIARHAGKG